MSRAAWTGALGALLALASPLFDTPSLALPGLALLALGLGSAMWVGLAARGARVRRTLGPPTVIEDEPYPVRIELRAGLVPPPRGELRDPLLEGPAWLGGRERRGLRIHVRFARRGRHALAPGELVMADPLGLAQRRLAVGGDEREVLVLPRTEPVRAVVGTGGAGGPAAGAGSDRGMRRGRVAGSAAELDLDGLRPYRRGTPASRIHWPAVARSGEMLERRLVADADSAPLVVLDASLPRSQEDLDKAVRAAASLALHLARAGGCAVLLPGDRRPAQLGADLSGWPALHARLAEVETARERPRVAALRRAGAVIWVGAGPPPPRGLGRAFGGGGWHVSPSPAATPAFTVSGCAGVALGAGRRRSGVAA